MKTLKFVFEIYSPLVKEIRVKKVGASAQCARTDLNKRFLPKPMTTTG